MLLSKKSLFILVFIVVTILLIPLIAMQFTKEVNWNLLDFITATILLFGTGLALKVIVLKTRNIKYRISIICVLLFLFLAIWAELAVGIFGSPIAGN